ncbi:MAG TPA: tetratricopeptide repeat protein [Rickettsia endosymbiont of Omalisus fontisbellaquei]|nr:tetratricopeptide repeat protein [Rickettsia endosymbiont of Omalisus fontisbellaquei]
MLRYILITVIILLSNNIFAQSQISNLVIPVNYFVDHIKQLVLLQDNLAKYRQASVVGVSGMGKTQLARMYAYENKDKYDIIWFIDCNLDIDGQLLKLAKTINTQADSPVIPDNVSVIRKELISYLASKDKWLLVFDNLKIKENKKIEEFINWEHNGNIIFCSQDSELLPNIIKMSSFNKKDSLTLLQNILKNENPAIIEFLVQEFEGYPVLMVQGTQLLNQVKGLSIEEYKKKISISNDKIGLNMKLVINELKPSANRLLSKIALINNQSFSKELLNFITDNKNSLDDDIYQLSKFALISNIEPNETNPVFETHDVISKKILEMSKAKNNRNYLEEIIVKFVSSMPVSINEEMIIQNKKTIRENLSIIFKNSEKYNVSIYRRMDLAFHSLNSYFNIFDYYNVKKMIDWFNKNDGEGKFKLWLMNNNEKQIYVRYLGAIGAYYIHKAANRNKSLEYYLKANQVLDSVQGAETVKNNIYYNLAIGNIHLGNLQKAETYIQLMEYMFENKLVDKSDISFLYFVKARLFCFNGQYVLALEQINNCIDVEVKLGLPINDFAYTQPYLLKAEILNSIGRYQEAYKQAEQVYKMYKPVKQEEHEVFARIFVQMSRAELGLGKAKEALEYAKEAETIFVNDVSRNNKNITTSTDTQLARAYVAKGDALAALRENEKAVESYTAAEVIYYNNYRGNMKNIDEISYMYLSATKAACKLPNKHWYSKFHNQHMEKFGAEHPRSIEILKLKCFD